MQRLLIRGVNWLGDAVMTTPALLRLREAHPSVHIAVLTPSHLADLYLHHPAVDEIVSLPPGSSPWAAGRLLRPRTFHTALILPNSPRSALECAWAGIPRRVGYARGLRGWLLTHSVPPRADAIRMRKPGRREIARRLAGRSASRQVPWSAHHTFDYLHLAATLGANAAATAPRLAIVDDEVREARQALGLSTTETWLGLNPGAEYGPAKRWPAERFAQAARDLSARAQARWVILGGRRDEPLASEIAAQVPGSINLAGRTSLRQLMAVLRVCRVLLTNDTGPMHVAAALGVPVVVPFGSTSPELTGPGLPGDPRHRLIRTEAACAPCFLRECPIDFRCLLGTGPERVVEAVLERLSSQTDPSSEASPRR